MIKTYPMCVYCGRTFEPGRTWNNANACRAVFLAEWLERSPGLSAWELSQQTGMSYADVGKGLTKGRELDLIAVAGEEEREQGGKRYRYAVGARYETGRELLQQQGLI